jgi:ADP-ribose pyrophosphatase
VFFCRTAEKIFVFALVQVIMEFDISDAEVVKKENCYNGFFKMDRYTVRHRLYDGSMSEEFTRELFERGHASAVLLYDPVKDAVVMIEQFRIGALAAGMDPWLYEVVAGINEPGEKPEDVVVRESLEEAGVSVENLRFVTRYLVSPGGTSETLYLYVGTVDSSKAGGVHGLADEHENIRVHVVPFKEALSMADDGRICNATALISIYYLASHRDIFLEQVQVK